MCAPQDCGCSSEEGNRTVQWVDLLGLAGRQNQVSNLLRPITARSQDFCPCLPVNPKFLPFAAPASMEFGLKHTHNLWFTIWLHPHHLPMVETQKYAWYHINQLIIAITEFFKSFIWGKKTKECFIT